MKRKLSSNLVEIVKCLHDGEYHDGTTLGDQLSMTRSAVWKAIKKLIAQGVNIKSIKGKGYALMEPLILLDQQTLTKKLSSQHVQVMVFDSIDSTNSYLRSYPAKRHIMLCLAEQQTQGRGRLGRNWHSPFGKNIYLSCSFPFEKDMSELSGLSLVVSLAIAQVLQKQYGLEETLKVKWPNDIVYQGQKLGGVLLDIEAEPHAKTHAVIGIGLNVNMLSQEATDITQPWVSLQQIVSRYIDRNELVILIVKQLLHYLQQFNDQGFSAFQQEWIENDHLMGKEITISQEKQNIDGKVLGVNEQGHLLLQTINNQLRAFSSGDASVKKY